MIFSSLTKNTGRTVALAAWVALSFQAQAEDVQRVVTIGGSLTEIVYRIGQEVKLVGRDSTSLYPQAVNKLPDVGYIRRLSPEGVLSVDPNLILTLEGAGPPEAVQVLKTAKVRFESVPEQYDEVGVLRKIEAIGKALKAEREAEDLTDEVRKGFEDLRALTAPIDKKKRVLFVLSITGGKVLSAGTNTAAAGIVELAGGENAFDDFTGYKPLSDEAIIAAQPDVVLMMDRRENHASSDEDLLTHPAIALTPAGKSGNLLRMDGLYLLGFGPRTPDAAKDLARALYGDTLGTQ